MKRAAAGFRPAMSTAAARRALLGLLMLLVGCDHVTKIVAKSELEGERPRELIRGVLDLHYTENRDVAFNLLRWIPEGPRTKIVIVAGALALLGLAVALVRRPPRALLTRAALLLVAAGAAGNYVDRLARGYVVDFVYLHHWPVFNVADAYVTVGGVMLGLSIVGLRRARAEA
jgi:signal peptidase II